MVFQKLELEKLQLLHTQAQTIAKEFLQKAHGKPGQIVVVGCSTSEVLGRDYGTFSHPDVGEAIFTGLDSVFRPAGVYLAAQCCEHLNRAIAVERDAVPGAETVNVIPQPKAGGSFATAAWRHMDNPVALEAIKADAGLDIGGTMIGMHLKPVAVPFRLENNHLGSAIVLSAYTRPKYIGGERAVYDPALTGKG